MRLLIGFFVLVTGGWAQQAAAQSPESLKLIERAQAACRMIEPREHPYCLEDLAAAVGGKVPEHVAVPLCRKALEAAHQMPLEWNRVAEEKNAIRDCAAHSWAFTAYEAEEFDPPYSLDGEYPEYPPSQSYPFVAGPYLKAAHDADDFLKRLDRVMRLLKKLALSGSSPPLDFAIEEIARRYPKNKFWDKRAIEIFREGLELYRSRRSSDSQKEIFFGDQDEVFVKLIIAVQLFFQTEKDKEEFRKGLSELVYHLQHNPRGEGSFYVVSKAYTGLVTDVNALFLFRYFWVIHQNLSEAVEPLINRYPELRLAPTIKETVTLGVARRTAFPGRLPKVFEGFRQAFLLQEVTAAKNPDEKLRVAETLTIPRYRYLGISGAFLGRKIDAEARAQFTKYWDEAEALPDASAEEADQKMHALRLLSPAVYEVDPVSAPARIASVLRLSAQLFERSVREQPDVLAYTRASYQAFESVVNTASEHDPTFESWGRSTFLFLGWPASAQLEAAFLVNAAAGAAASENK